MELTNPIWLLAIAAVAIPVAIHLWNIRPGRVLKVGSISLIEAAARKSSRSLNLLDILLLILRCLLLIVLAMVLAIPLWHKTAAVGKAKGWILIPKENLESTYQHFKTGIDSLIKAGYEFHYFDRGFSKTDLSRVLANTKDSLANTDTTTSNYWNLAKQLDTTVSPALPARIFTPNLAANFSGTKPQTSLNLNWRTYVPADSTATWIQDAWINNNNTIRVATGTSKPSGTIFTYTNVQSGDQPGSPFTVAFNNGRTTVCLKTGKRQPVVVDTAVLKIAVYADGKPTDAAYLIAVLKAAIGFMQRKADIKQYIDANAIPKGRDWLFWLSAKQIPAELQNTNAHLFEYEAGKSFETNSWISNEGAFVTTQQNQKIELFKLIDNAEVYNNVLWRDGFGNPVLSKENNGQTDTYHFYSRFNPAWNNLVWSDDFAGWMLNLIVGDKTSTRPLANDRTILTQQQIDPINIPTARTSATKTAGFANISNYFWLALMLLFLTERWLATRTQNSTTNG